MANDTRAASRADSSGTFLLGGELPVHRLGFGAMRLTGPGIIGPPADREEAIRVLRRCLELNVNFIDTAESYGPHISEEIIAEALSPYPADLVIATKGGLDRPGRDAWRPNGHPERLREELEGSLRRLRVERIDLWQLHRIDARVPEEEQFGVMSDFVREGKVRFLGLSEVDLAQLERARRVLPIVSVQNRYNLTDRQWDPVLDYCTREGIAFLPWFPLHFSVQGEGEEVLARIAARHASTATQIALAWLLHRSPVMLPIPGTSRVKHLEENVAAAAIRLNEEELSQLGGLAGGG